MNNCNEKKEKLLGYFKARINQLQKAIDNEIAKQGGADMCIGRIDLLEWIYFSRQHIEHCKTICQMIEKKDTGSEKEKAALDALRESVVEDQKSIEEIQRKDEEQKKILERLREETGYYQQALEFLKPENGAA